MSEGTIWTKTQKKDSNIFQGTDLPLKDNWFACEDGK